MGLKTKLAKLKKGGIILRRHGVYSLTKWMENKRFHRRMDPGVIKESHLTSQQELESQRRYRFEDGVKFSIITPLYNTPKEFLEELIVSLKEQTYGNWELCLADGSDHQHTYVGEMCRRYAAEDTRIRYQVLDQNRGISENTNECIRMATGEYYGLLDHDDLLHPSALYHVMKAISEDGADFLYTDEVKFSGKVEDIDNPLAFNLKPGFGVDDLRSHNYICHFTVFHRRLLDGEKELYRKEFDGSQDHDMVLRMTEKAQKITHIPRVLYYWRVHEQSVSMDLGTKPYAVKAGIDAVKDQLIRQKEEGSVASSAPFQTLYRVEYAQQKNPLVSILVHGAMSDAGLELAVRRLAGETCYRPLEIVYVSEKEIELGEEIRGVRIKEKHEKEAEHFNHMAEKAQGEYLVLLEAACRPSDGNWIKELLMHAQRKQVAAVSPKIYFSDGRICYAGIVLDESKEEGIRYLCSHDVRGDIGYEAMLCHVRNTSASTKLCMMVKKQIWQELNGFDTAMSGYEAIDFSLRALQAGKRNIWTAYAELTLEGDRITQRTLLQAEKFKGRWKEAIQKENYCHPLWETLHIV